MFTKMHHQFWKPFYILCFLRTFVNNEWELEQEALTCYPPAIKATPEVLKNWPLQLI